MRKSISLSVVGKSIVSERGVGVRGCVVVVVVDVITNLVEQ